MSEKWPSHYNRNIKFNKLTPHIIFMGWNHRISELEDTLKLPNLASDVCIEWFEWFCQLMQNWHKEKWQLEKDVSLIAHVWKTSLMPWIKDVLLSSVPVWEKREKMQAKLHITSCYYWKNTLSLATSTQPEAIYIVHVFLFSLRYNRSQRKNRRKTG